MLIIFGGLPGTGKSTLAQQLARKLGAAYLRIDTIERAIAACDEAVSINDKGYQVAYALAEDNLRLGHTVIGDSVNPLQITRSAWRSAAERAAVRAIEIEVICSDLLEHRRRIETRVVDIPVTWDEVVARTYETLDRQSYPYRHCRAGDCPQRRDLDAAGI
jgi:predicted kinase